MKSLINGRLILPDERGDFKICAGEALNFDDKIISIGEPADGTEVIDAENNFVAPGFINVHIHGAAGVDAMDDDLNALQRLADFLPLTGVTSFLPTTMAAPIKKIHGALERIRAGENFNHGAKILGAHVESPFISKKYCGAQDTVYIIPADFALIENFADVIKIITVAPEVTGFDFIERCLEAGIIVSIGHSAATYEEAMAAIERGASHITHLFNAQTPFHHRKAGVVGAAFDSAANVELIADNVHVSPVAQRIVAKVKPRRQIVLITDSMRACGLGNGISELGGQKVFVKGNLATLEDGSRFKSGGTANALQRPITSISCRAETKCLRISSPTYDYISELGGQKVFVKGNLATLEDGTIAGSVAKMNEVLRNFCANTELDEAAGVELATKNPAVELNIYDERGSLEVGKAADITVFDDDFNIKKTFVNGSL